MKQQRSYLFLAPGFEEIEALATVDVLRRAGMEVCTVAVKQRSISVKGAHGVSVEADILTATPISAMPNGSYAPGGMPGATNLAETVVTMPERTV